MDQLIAKQFGKALVFLLKKEGWGAQARLAREKDIDRGYLNAIIQGRKTGSEHVRSQIADYFHMPYEEMLALGRRLLEGTAPDREARASQGAERLQDALEKESGGTGGISGSSPGSPRISEIIQKAIVILESDTNYRHRLTDLIDTFHRELMAQEESTVLRSQLTAMEMRIAHLENMLADEKNGTRKSA
ncbi:MAG: hypothetical protein C4530_17520 [Desulfobacteraceae bacterium]|nr:MAG: hypothetical protein C4530_17520 [Desulfobacteraceae bacterium]